MHARARLTVAFAWLLALALGCSAAPPAGSSLAALGAPSIGVTHALAKVRPDFVVPPSTTATVEAARNEFEPFQIVLNGGASGLQQVTAQASVPGIEVRLYRVDLYHVKYASNVEGAPGEWPDPLVPDVDAYFGEKRNAFPFDVPAGESRAIWVELYVPPGTPAGPVHGKVTVQAASGLGATPVAVELRVRDFDLPSTASLPSAFGFSVDLACRAHKGETYCQTDADARPFTEVYGRAALDHRISFWNPYYTFPSGGDFTTFDQISGPLLSGTAKTRLQGAHMTTTALGTKDANGRVAARMHFDQKGWKDLFDYTCDEPPATCAFSDIPTRAQAVHAAGVRTLVTTDIDAITSHNLFDAIDIAVPVIDYLWPDGKGSRRAEYDAFLKRSPAKELWTYQSCDEHGCGSGCTAGQASSTIHGWPSVMIDASGVQNRAMEWMSYRAGVTGELYYETVLHLDDAWNSHLAGHDALCDFGGNGDGALFYPGTPARIGGATDIPISSQRLELIREGMEDYEYLHLCDVLGLSADAQAAAQALFPNAWQVASATPDQLYAARAHLADLIEGALAQKAPTGIPHLGAPLDVHGDGHELASLAPITVAAGDARADFRLAWDEQALYLSAEVTDPLLRAIGTGTDGELWNADGIELLVDSKHDRSAAPDDDDRHLIVTEAGDLLDARGAGANEDRSLTTGASHAVTGTATGYRVLLSIPWSGLGVTPSGGLEIGADLALNDLGASALAARDWAGVTPFARPLLWNALRLDAAGGGSDPNTGGSGTAGGGTGGDDPGGNALHAGCAMSSGADGSALALLLLCTLALLTVRRRARL